MRTLRPLSRSFLLIAGMWLLLQPVGTAQEQKQSLNVLHWWTSTSEQRAADELRTHLINAGVLWNDAAIPGGGGMAAIKVLKSRLLMGDPPDVAQLIGSSLADWADRGLVLPLTVVAGRQNWSQALFPTVDALVRYKDEVIAAPLGIHRINTLFYNRRVFEKLKLKPPRTWSEFDAATRVLNAAGIRSLAWSDEAWQVATVFESLLLSEVGPTLYLELITQRKSAAWLDPKVEAALRRLRLLRKRTGERSWTSSARDLMSGSAAMMIMGDWVNGELKAWGADPQTDFACVAVPGTSHMHLYSVDTLAMLVNPRHHVALQEKMAETLHSRAVQLAYNRIKGSVPVRKDLSAAQVATMDACARDSWETFAAPDTARVPSLAHRMAADESTKDAVAQTLWRYLTDPRMDVREVQKRLGSDIHAP